MVASKQAREGTAPAGKGSTLVQVLRPCTVRADDDTDVDTEGTDLVQESKPISTKPSIASLVVV